MMTFTAASTLMMHVIRATPEDVDSFFLAKKQKEARDMD